MDRRKRILFRCIFALMLLLLAAPALAAGTNTKKTGWFKGEDGVFTYYRKGKALESTYFKKKKLGIAKVGKNYYCYRKNGQKYTGLLKVNSTSWYYFKPSNKGRMVINKRIKINKKYYYFGADGLRVINTWVGKRYYGAKGVQVFGKFVGNRYVNAKGLMVIGAQTIDGNLYYFDPSNGEMLTNAVKEIDGTVWYFDANGIGRRRSEYGTVVETSYFTDPKVDDETLLSAIIYAEAGNQPYYGQLAVGLVIMNRVQSSLFPNHLKDVIYASQQFEPARNTWLTRALKGEIRVTESCKSAAKEALARAKSGNRVILKTDENNKKVDMTGYLFFMTPKAFERLKLKSEHIVLKDHVFFKLWQR